MQRRLSTPTDATDDAVALRDGESGIIFDIKRYAIHDGPGIRTTVFFKGCPLRCAWCHNPESWRREPELALRGNVCLRCGLCTQRCPEDAISIAGGCPTTAVDDCVFCGECVDECPAASREIIGQVVTAEEVMKQVERDRVFHDQSGGGVTFSGGEPLSQPAFLLNLLRRGRELEIHTAVDTSLYCSDDLIDRILPLTDLFLIDLKHMDDEVHSRLTGVSNQQILKNVHRVCSGGGSVLFRLPVVPGINDQEENVVATARFVASLPAPGPIELLPYNRLVHSKLARFQTEYELIECDPPSPQRLEEIARQMSAEGIETKIGGK